MNEYYNRIKELFETAGIRVTEGSANDGEAYAYSAALAAVAAPVSRAAARTGMDGAAATDFPYFAALLGIDATRFTAEALAEEVTARLAHSFGDYTADDAAHAFQLVGSGGMSVEDGALTFVGIHPEDLPVLGNFLAAYHYCGVPVSYTGNGMTFDEWEAMDFPFEQYDRLQLPWSILDHYRRSV